MKPKKDAKKRQGKPVKSPYWCLNVEDKQNFYFLCIVADQSLILRRNSTFQKKGLQFSSFLSTQNMFSCKIFISDTLLKCSRHI